MEALRKTAIFRIEKQTADLEPEEVRVISLNGVPLLPDNLLPFTSLTQLTLVGMRPPLKSLSDVPFASLPQLRMADLSDNAIATVGFPTATEGTSAVSPSLKRLFLSNNRLSVSTEARDGSVPTTLTELVAAFPTLEVLDISLNTLDGKDTETVDTALIAAVAFRTFPSLVAFNGMDENGQEVEILESDEDPSDEDTADDEDDSDDSLDGDEDESDEDEDSDESGDSDEESDHSSADEPPEKSRRCE